MENKDQPQVALSPQTKKNTHASSHSEIHIPYLPSFRVMHANDLTRQTTGPRSPQHPSTAKTIKILSLTLFQKDAEQPGSRPYSGHGLYCR